MLVKDVLVGSLFYTVFENVPFCSGCFELAVATFCFQIARGKPQKLHEALLRGPSFHLSDNAGHFLTLSSQILQGTVSYQFFKYVNK